MRDDLEAKLKEAAAQVRAMTPEQREKMYRKQRESYVRAEMSWPKAKYHWEMRDGQRCKVYESWEDYCND